MKKLKVVLFSFLIMLIVAELVLRYQFGFCDAVLIQEDPDYEYIAMPNQDRRRFGKHIFYNAFSMRSEQVDSTAETILGFGDSVINGGTLTDQDSLATELLSDTLSVIKGKRVQVLNISAGSWGPDNCAAYLAKHGDFQAKAAFLVVSSHDAFDNMDFKKTVGVNINYPDRQYKLALEELVVRYLIPRLAPQNDIQADLGINKGGDGFNTGFAYLTNYFQSRNIPFFICLHPEAIELENGSYNSQGQLIIDFCERNNVPLIQTIKVLNSTDFRDNNHLNEAGQKKLYNVLLDQLKSYLL